MSVCSPFYCMVHNRHSMNIYWLNDSLLLLLMFNSGLPHPVTSLCILVNQPLTTSLIRVPDLVFLLNPFNLLTLWAISWYGPIPIHIVHIEHETNFFFILKLKCNLPIFLFRKGLLKLWLPSVGGHLTWPFVHLSHAPNQGQRDLGLTKGPSWKQSLLRPWVGRLVWWLEQISDLEFPNYRDMVDLGLKPYCLVQCPPPCAVMSLWWPLWPTMNPTCFFTWDHLIWAFTILFVLDALALCLDHLTLILLGLKVRAVPSNI